MEDKFELSEEEAHLAYLRQQEIDEQIIINNQNQNNE